jgi:hypothetical protein
MAEAPTTVFQLNGFAGSPAQPGSDFCPTNQTTTHCTDPAPAGTCTYLINNVITSGLPCDNWNLLNGTGPGDGAAGHSGVRSFIEPATLVFTKGTKDTQDVSAWDWAPHGSPGKDTFNAGYAAAYVGPSTGDLLVIFGADRQTNNGDANIGVWFFQLGVTAKSDGTFSCGLPAGSSCHLTHDIFVTSAFTNGGGVSGLNVYEWDTACASITNTVNNPAAGQCADTNLRLLILPTSICGTANECGQTNSATTHTSWEGAIASPQFFEGGIDITAALAVAGVTTAPCFSTFQLETRASQSSGAELKAFILGGFPVCSVSITKTCDTSTAPSIVTRNGTAYVHYNFTGKFHNDGIGTIFGLTVADTFPTNSINQVLNQPTTPLGGLLTHNDASYSGSFEVPTTAQVTNHVTATAASFSGGSQDVTTDHNGNLAAADAQFGTVGTACSAQTNPSLTLSKSCVVDLVPGSSGIVLALHDTITVCNNSPDASTTISGITLTNNVLLNGSTGTDQSIAGASNITLTPSGANSCKTFTPIYTPTQCDGGSPSLTGGRCEFTDTVRIDTVASTPKDEFGTAVPAAKIALPQQASCHICPFGACTLSGTP